MGSLFDLHNLHLSTKSEQTPKRVHVYAFCDLWLFELELIGWHGLLDAVQIVWPVAHH